MNRSHHFRCREERLRRGHRRPSSSPSALLLLYLSLLLGFVPSAPVGAEEIPPWGGAVLDLVGRGIPGVEILAFPVGRDSSDHTYGLFRTDDQGRFRLAGLSPGSYFLALNKPGYEILLAQVNTRWISRITLTLIPGSSALSRPADIRGDSMDWVLRLPRTDLLKEVDAQGMLAERSGGKGPAGPEIPGREGATAASSTPGRLPVNGEVEQWFTTDPSFGAGGPEMASSSGRATTLKVDGDLLGRGSWQVGGVLGTLNTESGEAGPGGGEQNEGAGRFRVAMHYDLNPEDKVQFRARYDRDSFSADPVTAASTPHAQEVRTLGYQAGWQRKLERGSGLEMNVGFIQAMGRVPDGMPLQDLEAGNPEDRLLQDRRWNAGALYGFNMSEDHRIHVRAATRFYRYEEGDLGWVLAPIQPGRTFAEAGERGWSVSLSGEDSWRISEPLSLILGLDYHRGGTSEGFSSLVPRVGARREGERSVVQGEILLRLDAPGTLAAGDLSVSGAGEPGQNSLGFNAEVLHRVGVSWTVSGHARRSPLGGDADTGWLDPRGPGDPGALVLVDASSVTEEVGFEISKQLKGIKGTLGTDQGRIRGRVAARLDGAPIQALGQGDIRYLSLKAAASVPLSDTEVRFDYSRMDGLESALVAGTPYQAARLDLAVLQQIPPLLRKYIPADWRLLLAYQSLARDPSGAAETEKALPERVRRLSGGVGVKF